MNTLFILALALTPNAPVREAEWATINGKIVWDEKKPIPEPHRQAVSRNSDNAKNDDNYDKETNTIFTEAVVINAKNRGFKNVIVWLAPEPTDEQLKSMKGKSFVDFPSFAVGDIHRDLVKLDKDTLEIDQPCCHYVPHVLCAREGQKLVVKNSSNFPYNVKLDSQQKNGNSNVLLTAGKSYQLENPLVAERSPISIGCSIYPWMQAWVRVFNHPYFAVTDADGKFEIKNAPIMKGKLRLFIWQENYGYSNGREGRLGQTIDVKAGTVSLGNVKFETKD